MRERIRKRLAEAEQGGDQVTLCTLRLVNMAIQDRDKLTQVAGKSELVSDHTIHNLVLKMIEQRKKSSVDFEEHGQLDLADRERREIDVLQDLLPEQLQPEEVRKAVDKILRNTRASGIRDKGRVMQALKSQYAGKMNFQEVNEMVTERLS